MSISSTLWGCEHCACMISFVLVCVWGGGEGVILTTPPGFSQMAEERQHATPPFLQTSSHINFAPFQKISAKCHLRSCHLVGSDDPTSKNIYDCDMSTVFKMSVWNFQELMMVSVPTRRISRNFDFGDLILWPKFRSILRPDNIAQWENVQILVLFESTSEIVISITRYSYIGPLSMTHMQFWPNDLSLRSFEVIWGQICFLPLTFDRIKIERWEWLQSVSFAKTHRLIRNMTYLA